MSSKESRDNQQKRKLKIKTVKSNACSVTAHEKQGDMKTDNKKIMIQLYRIRKETRSQKKRKFDKLLQPCLSNVYCYVCV